jgi:hypothetical protein
MMFLRCPLGAIRFNAVNRVMPVAVLGASAMLTACSGGVEPVDNSTFNASPEISSRYALANKCVALQSVATNGYVTKNNETFAADAPTLLQSEGFFMKPAALGIYLFFDRDEAFLSVDDGATSLASPNSVRPDDAPSDATVWELVSDGAQDYSIIATGTGKHLAVEAVSTRLVLRDGEATAPSARFRFAKRDGCAAYPEAELNATGEPFSGTNPDGTVKGVLDGHSHIISSYLQGGTTFHPWGAAYALIDDPTARPGPQGVGQIGQVTRGGTPVDGAAGTSGGGWPDFVDWPHRGSRLFTQTYYVWLKRSYMAGLRLLVTHALGHETLCSLLFQGVNCNEKDWVKFQSERAYALQNYIDAQAGGPGQGFFRIVRTPVEARQVIEDGKLAVVLGTEQENPVDCGEFLDEPRIAGGARVIPCTREDIDRGLTEIDELGIRSVFISHWHNNAFSGGGLFGSSGGEINLLNKAETGNYYRIQDCPESDAGMGAELDNYGAYQEGDDPLSGLFNDVQLTAVPTYPPGRHCNAKGLTSLGEYFIEGLMKRGMIIETDHLSAHARNRVLEIAEANDYPVYSGHFHAGGTSSPSQFDRIYRLGGLAAPVKPHASDFPSKVRMLQAFKGGSPYFGVGLSSDVNGATMPGPPGEDEPQITYPFQSFDGGVTFERQRTGNRTFDYNNEGVAHYGLFAEYIENIRQQDDGQEAIEQLFRSAEAYLQMWEKAHARGLSLN